MKQYKEDFLFISLLVLLAIFSHPSWFQFGSVLSYADIWFQHISTLKESLITHTWISNINFGNPNIQLYKLLFTLPWGILAFFGVSFSDVLRITHLIPTAILGFVAPYFLFRTFFSEKFPAFVGAVFYGSATPFLVRQYQGHASIAFIIAFFPLIFWIFVHTIKKNTSFLWIMFSLFYFFGVCYEVRMMYVVTFVFALYFLFFREYSIRFYIPKVLLALAVFLGLSAFWILPLLFGNFSGAIEDIIARDLFANAHFSILRSLALFQPYWTGAEPQIFHLQPILWYFWVIPALVFIFFFFRSEKTQTKQLHFFAVVALVGLLLTKQVGEPLPFLFQWLREHIPGFLAFRSGSKFWFLLTFSYAGIVVYGLSYLKTRSSYLFHKVFFVLFSVVILGISLLHLSPTVLGTFGGMFETRKIPEEYLGLAQHLEQESDFFRVLWVPVDSRWSYYSLIHPKISGLTLSKQFFYGFSSLNYVPTDPIQETFEKIFQLDSLNDILDNLSVKYVVIPLRDVSNDDDFFLSYGAKFDPNIRSWYTEELKKLSWLKELDLGVGDLVVFENSNWKPHFYSPETLTYTHSYFANLATAFGGDFLSEDSGLFTDHGYLVDSVQNIFLPIEGDQEKIHHLQSQIYKERDSEKKKILQSELDWYRGGYFFKDFILNVPQEQTYTVLIHRDSLISRIPGLLLKIGETSLTRQSGLKNPSDSDWLAFQQVRLDSGSYPIRLFSNGEEIETIDQQDIIFVAEDIVEAIKVPDILSKSMSPTEYTIDIRGAEQSFPLIFSESYNEGWTLSIVSGQKKSVVTKHFLVNNFANGWWVDLSQWEDTGYIVVNDDGTYDFSLELIFQPQEYFVRGTYISVFTGFLIFSYLLYKLSLNVYNRHKK